MDKVQAVAVTVTRGEGHTLLHPMAALCEGCGADGGPRRPAGRLIRIYLVVSKAAL